MDQSEKEFSLIVVNRLSQWFNIREEQWSDCGKFRIDYIIQDKNFTNVYFGLEFKKSDYKRGENIGSHILQSMGYSTKLFPTSNGNYQRMPILVCPPISYNYLQMPENKSKRIDKHFNLPKDVEYFHDRHDKHCKHHSGNGMLGALNIGEIRTTVQDQIQRIYFVMSNQTLWTSETEWGTNIAKGLHKVNYEKCFVKINKFKIV